MRCAIGRRVAGICVVFALLLPGCGGGASTDHATGDGTHGEGQHTGHSPVVGGARVIDVTASSFSFNPAEIVVQAGEDVTIEMTATDTFHDLMVEGSTFHVAAQPGERAEGGLRIPTPGTYTAYCSVPGHRAAGMEMTITAQ
jgi:heme/copper-type cytochrome/quinol oxidase subunit 2